jgi:23S rRNA (cytidine2498-2'-O)-methyltransferase
VEDLTAAGAHSAYVLTCSSGWEQEARAEVRRALGRAEPPVPHEFDPLIFKGNLLLRCEAEEERVLDLLAAASTRALAQVVPVQARVSLADGREAFSRVAVAAARTGRLRRGDTFVVRCHRRGRHDWQSRDLEKTAALALEETTGAVGEYLAPARWTVSVQVYQELAFIGVYRTEGAIKKEVSLQRKYPPGERPVSRAEWKLKEAFEAFRLELPAGARALDLGAAPGGWTRVLSGLGAQVLAVDPAELHPEVAARPNVVHLRRRAEDMAEAGEPEASFDLLTNDMNLDPAESARLMCRLARFLKPGAPAIMTVKLMTAARRRHQKEAAEILAPEYEGLRFQRLPHNAREITAVMRRKSGA